MFPVKRENEAFSRRAHAKRKEMYKQWVMHIHGRTYAGAYRALLAICQ